LSNGVMKLIAIRHSNREHIKSNETAHLAQLTPEGINNAVTFGRKLNDKFNVKIDNIYTSFVERCVETGDLIRKAHAFDLFTEDINLIPAEGHDNLITLGYVKLHKRMEWLSYVHKMFVNNEVDYPQMFKELYSQNMLLHKDIKEYSEHFLSEYFHSLSNNLIITHDTNIGPIIHHLSIKYNFYLENYMIQPKPLCGFCLSKEKGMDIIHWVNFEDEEIYLKRLT